MFTLSLSGLSIIVVKFWTYRKWVFLILFHPTCLLLSNVWNTSKIKVSLFFWCPCDTDWSSCSVSCHICSHNCSNGWYNLLFFALVQCSRALSPSLSVEFLNFNVDIMHWYIVTSPTPNIGWQYVTCSLRELAWTHLNLGLICTSMLWILRLHIWLWWHFCEFEICILELKVHIKLPFRWLSSNGPLLNLGIPDMQLWASQR